MTAPSVKLSIEGDREVLFTALAALPWFEGLPVRVSLDRRNVPPAPDWRESATKPDLRDVAVYWADADGDRFGGRSLAVFGRTGVVSIYLPNHGLSADELIKLASALPVSVMALGRGESAWTDRSPRFSFASGHSPHGWGAIFKGDGHARLVSERWYEHGPWVVRRAAGNLTYLQFHDLNAETPIAIDQATRAHERIGISDVGGYIHAEHPIQTRISGLYKAADRTFTVTRGNGQPMAQREMLDLCAYRARMRGDASEPIERVRVLFMEERDARRHLHELWLRELECWYVDGEGREVRADEAYAPERIRPEWVERAEGVAPVTRGASVRFERGLAQLAGALGDWTRDLLFHLLDHHDPGDGYSVREILDADLPRVSASAGETGELVVGVQQGVGGAMASAEAAPILEKAHAVAARAETWVPAERLGLTLPAVIVPDPYLDQRPIRLGDDHPLRGVVVHGVGDVLARVRSLNREDLREVEGLLRLCQEQRLVVSARATADQR
jgi:hypothetical protein